MKYPLAKQGVFATIQGEGKLLGVPMVFIRLAGCSVGCPECDTDYSVSERATTAEIVRRVVECATNSRWVWITGGEPTTHNLQPLVSQLRDYAFKIALATSGVGHPPIGVEFVSVSPHRIDDNWVLRHGNQLNIVPGLNGLRLEDLEDVDVSGFAVKYVTPCWYTPGDRAERVAECVAWVQSHSGWRLGIQAHKNWGVA